MEPPEVLYEFEPKRVFCLTTDTHHLVLLRQARQNYLGGATGDYATVEYVKNELIYARRIYNRHPDWTIINVTNKPIEEIASEILLIVKSKETS